MRRGSRCITLGQVADTTLRQLVSAAQTNYHVASKLGLTTQPLQQRALTQPEIDRLATLIGKPDLQTEAAVMRALSSADPEKANAVTRLIDEYYRTAPRINASRIIEALIFQGAQAIEAEPAVSVADGRHDGQSINKSANRSARQTNAPKSVYRGRSKVA